MFTHLRQHLNLLSLLKLKKYANTIANFNLKSLINLCVANWNIFLAGKQFFFFQLRIISDSLVSSIVQDNSVLYEYINLYINITHLNITHLKSAQADLREL